MESDIIFKIEKKKLVVFVISFMTNVMVLNIAEKLLNLLVNPTLYVVKGLSKNVFNFGSILNCRYAK